MAKDMSWRGGGRGDMGRGKVAAQREEREKGKCGAAFGSVHMKRAAQHVRAFSASCVAQAY